MKKLFMVAAMAVAALTANAQVWIGGNLGVSSTSIEDTDKSITKFSVQPEVGYSLSDKWDVALALGYKYSNEDVKTNTFYIQPYARYTFYRKGQFYAFCDGYLQYSTTDKSGSRDNLNTFGVGLTPGLGYDLTKHVTLVAHVGDLSYAHAWQGDINANSFNFGVTNNISFGAYVKF